MIRVYIYIHIYIHETPKCEWRKMGGSLTGRSVANGNGTKK